jgi:hypothetical protein
MKSFLAITVGISMLATAGATAISTSNNVTTTVGVANQLTLTAEQAKVLQAKYRYWSSSQSAMTLRTPI